MNCFHEKALSYERGDTIFAVRELSCLAPLEVRLKNSFDTI